jgi:UDP-N-acetylglucosamine 4,6-dehydratase/5-epimerase
MFKNKSILITGGTGSFGRAFIKNLISKHKNFKRLVVFSRDELKQFEMSNKKEFQHPNLRMFIGDIRDKERLYRAIEGIDIVIHAAALKQVPTAEYNPFEYVKTNIIGTQNIVEVCLDRNVNNIVALSTDKASSPINLYGATKLCSDKLIISANNIKGNRKTKFSVVRYGNVMGSRGSVIPFFKKIFSTKKKLPLTHPEMTRFNISLNEAVKLVEIAIKNSQQGEIFVPKLKSFYVKDLIEAMSNKKNNFDIIGIRPGEKIHEELINPAESRNTVEFKDYYTILPYLSETEIKNYCKKNKSRIVTKNFSYNSGTNKIFMKLNELKAIIKD